MNSKVFWTRTILYVLITVFISKALSSEMFKLQKGLDWIADMSVLNKFFYASVKISVGVIYLRLVKVSWGNALMILATGLLFRFLNAPFTMVIIGCSIVLYKKDSLITTNSTKIDQNPD